ncbi:hypothetical protein XENTR_v10007165 [Xenopus tropicalis]|nr:hypothetical protein XENTR_v10007165 [Xenopus tropicalis]
MQFMFQGPRDVGKINFNTGQFSSNLLVGGSVRDQRASRKMLFSNQYCSMLLQRQLLKKLNKGGLCHRTGFHPNVYQASYFLVNHVFFFFFNCNTVILFTA